MLCRVKINLSSPLVREESLHGREYIVAPMAMLAEGVITGTDGVPTFYPGDEIAKSVTGWNAKPIVVYHPFENGAPVTACQPDVLNSSQVGIILNTVYDDKLRAEAWLEKDRLQLVDSRVLEALTAGTTIEISTGMHMDAGNIKGEFAGVSYQAIATNITADHLAILPDKTGAYSVAAGGGLLQINEQPLEKLKYAGLRQGDSWVAGNGKVKMTLTCNEMSFDKIHSAVQKALRIKYAGNVDADGYSNTPYVFDVFGDFFVMEMPPDYKMYKMSYVATDTGVTLSGEPQEVVRVTEYRLKKDGSYVANCISKPDKRNPDMPTKKEKIDALILKSNGRFVETDRRMLENSSEDLIEKLTGETAPVTNPASPPPPAVEPPSLEKKLASTPETQPAPVTNAKLSPEQEEDLAWARQEKQRQKDEIINDLVANVAAEEQPIKRASLAKKNLGELQELQSFVSNERSLAANSAVKDDATPPHIQSMMGNHAPPTAIRSNSGKPVGKIAPLAHRTMTFPKPGAKAE